MNGIVIYYSDFIDSRDDVGELEGSLFARLFASILKLTGNYYWFGDDSLLSSSHAQNEEEFDFFYNQLAAKKSPLWAPEELLPIYAKWINDDSTCLSGYEYEPSEGILERLRNRRDISDRVDADVLFINEDGAYWEIYAKDAALLDSVATHLKTNFESMCFWHVSFSKRAVWYTQPEKNDML